MKQFDIDDLSQAELKALQKQVAKAIETYDDRQKADARAKVEKIAKELGFTLADLVKSDARRATSDPSSVCYVNPEDPSKTWYGRGRKPMWFKAFIESGRNPADLIR